MGNNGAAVAARACKAHERHTMKTNVESNKAVMPRKHGSTKNMVTYKRDTRSGPDTGLDHDQEVLADPSVMDR